MWSSEAVFYFFTWECKGRTGFSVNSEITENNLKESSLVLQKMVYEGIIKESGIMKVGISNEMIMLVGHIDSIKQHRRRSKKTKYFLKRNTWKENG